MSGTSPGPGGAHLLTEPKARGLREGARRGSPSYPGFRAPKYLGPAEGPLSLGVAGLLNPREGTPTWMANSQHQFNSVCNRTLHGRARSVTFVIEHLRTTTAYESHFSPKKK